MDTAACILHTKETGARGSGHQSQPQLHERFKTRISGKKVSKEEKKAKGTAASLNSASCFPGKKYLLLFLGFSGYKLEYLSLKNKYKMKK